MKIFFDDRGATPVPKSLIIAMKRAALAAFRHAFDKDLKKLNYEVSVSLVSDDEMRELNKKYRDKDAPTDVLSFPLSEEPPRRIFLSFGDIVISTETAARQAEEYGHSFERELSFLTVHGVLHLLGLDHEVSPTDAAVMEEIQDEIMGSLHL
ncbi:MAG: rRNA maturation RNase YbeY [Defluviitaleaceae bacterium]|nr:rRNA maturation RNase YbeY [Defluviitaleaceae bacterium]